MLKRFRQYEGLTRSTGSVLPTGVKMKFFFSLIAGSLAISAADAADVSAKAKAIEYVKICSLYGTGYYYIPGTDTCLKFGGFVRLQTETKAGGTGQVLGNGV